jgi:hypothetical protein
MNVVISLVAVCALIAIALLGAGVAGWRYLFGVILP